MLKKRFIVVSRSAGSVDSIQALRGRFTGDLASVDVAFDEIAGAAEAIEHDLKGRGVKPRTATRLAWDMSRTQVGFIHHVPEAADMYYRILIAHFTSNKRPITPGLSVRDYDQRKGVVTAAQFMADSPMAPGGVYHDGWYYVEANREAKRYQGSKLVAL